ncbi:MAG: hypothetical protein KDK50_00745 [Chlamydiia bacterium]|nr:hypothetical protein [Chlamydiia bacterium]MCP5492793.1 hypothetical protein [Chlamydiales bacterium]
MIRKAYRDIWSYIVEKCTKYFSFLLVFLILLFVFRPYDRGGVYSSVWQFCLTGVFISSIFNVQHTKAVTWIIVLLGVPALVCNFLMFFYEDFIYTTLFYLLTFGFIMVCSGSIISKVLLNARVTMETLRGVVCVYFMIAFGFAFLFVMIEYVVPGSFVLDPEARNFYNHTRILSEMMFFSFVTLLSIGFGTINAIKDVAQTFTIIEGIIGQFYVAILVARLLGIYSYYADAKQAKRSKKHVFPEH